MRYFLATVFVLFAFLFTKGQSRYQYYYLAIGSANYEQNPSKFAESSFVPFDNLPEAALSARVMSALFGKYINAKGITFVTSEHLMVTKQRVVHLLEQLNQEIKKDRAAKPFIIFYYCGHGISENMGWNQFFIPGTYTRFPGDKNFEELSNKLIFLGDITDYFLKKHYGYMVLVDCCRKENKDSSLPEKRLSYFFNDQTLQTFKIVVQGLKYLNEYHQPNPVVFAIAPGSLAPTVPLPPQNFFRKPDGPVTDVGPVCRRAVLSVQKFETSPEKTQTIKGFVSAIINQNLDSQSPKSISFYEDTSKMANRLILLNK